MTETPVPISSCSVPEDAHAWLSADAAVWARRRPANWARPLWSILALLVTVAVAIAVEPEPACSDAVPCGTDWVGMVQMGLALGLLYWYARLPELTLVAAPALAAIVFWEEFPNSGWTSRAANVAVLVALALGWAATWARLGARRRQRQLVEGTVGIRNRLPEFVGSPGRGVFPIAAGTVLCAVAVGAIVLGLRAVHADEQHASRAVRTTAEVLSRNDVSLRVRTDDERHIAVDAVYPEDYGIGATVTVLEDGSWRRLTAEPYDAVGWQLLALAVGLPGLSLLITGVLARCRSAALRRGPVPALRVLERFDHEGRTWVYAVDDDSGRTPVFSCICVPTPLDGDEPDDPHGVAFDDETYTAFDTRLREAVMVGAPYEGSELVFISAHGDGNPVVMRTAGPVRLPRAGQGPVIHAQADVTDSGSDAPEPQDGDRVGRVAASLKPTGRPMRWGPTAVARAGGLALTGGIAVGAYVFTGSLMTDGFGWHVIPLLGLLMLISPAAVFLNWRVTADSTGLWLTDAWRTRHLPWEQLRAAVYTRDGSVEIRLSGGGIWQLSGLGWPWAERLLGLRPSYARMVEEVTALHAHPELRPLEQSPQRNQGRPLGPALVLLIGLVVISLFIK
ncbi:hypothetical protein [Streptomyces mirabilis]|uniref:hypothetical protein n=1 Tax=Streptomyces mirabilis TaxID=68239 RepID=UPI0036C2BA2D